MIPCVNILQKDNFVIFAVVLVILRKCANTLPSKISEAEAQSGAIVSQVGSRTETVQVRVAIDNDCSSILRFIIDTGSDWTVIHCLILLHHRLTLLHLLPSQLKKPTTEMKATVTATGEKMTPECYVYARFYFGQSYVDSKLVVFRDIKTPLLSIDVAKKLNIVHINTKGSPETLSSKQRNMRRVLLRIPSQF